ncbi:MAG: hypothetical protein DLM64_10650, partial [Solirubrobacterales bacterium]
CSTPRRTCIDSRRRRSISILKRSLRASVIKQGQLTLTPDALWTYEQAVELLMTRHAVLPARYGSTFETDAAARDMLNDQREELIGALEHVRGAVAL